jgi:hypothetical protein
MQCSAGASVAHKFVAVDGTFFLFCRYRHCKFDVCGSVHLGNIYV